MELMRVKKMYDIFKFFYTRITSACHKKTPPEKYSGSGFRKVCLLDEKPCCVSAVDQQ